ncbi:hypothetical protein DXV76_18790 [Rhodobacteraceae bacterium CCMM004]|nr:hypothetical protein DXV76_18790 [Rhodobacteraceae bacterium CCMM004]
MTAPLDRLAALRRPGLLIRAARHGLSDYNRRRTLARLFPDAAPAAGPETLAALLDREATLEDHRRTERTAYSVARHVEVLMAVLAEARLLRTGPT